MTKLVKLKVNGAPYEGEAEDRTLLVHFIREQLGLTGTHIGCDTGNCGACTILYEGRSVKSCMMLAVQCEGAELSTVEGLATDGKLHPLQEAFWEKHALQCGYCTPGMLMAGIALLKDNPSPTEQEIRLWLHGNLCRCTGYISIIDAIKLASEKMKISPN